MEVAGDLVASGLSAGPVVMPFAETWKVSAQDWPWAVAA